MQTKEEAAYYRHLFETVFVKNMLIYNTNELQNCINNLSEEKKNVIEKDFSERMKIWALTNEKASLN